MCKKVEVGQIWVVMNSFYSSEDGRNTHENRKVRYEIRKDEKLEVRYPFKWHLRTEDDLYFHISESTLLDNCLLFGTINSDVRANTSNLTDILKNKDYQPANKEYKNE